MKAWISKWLIFVSAGHTVVGIMFFGSIYNEMLSNGLLSSVNSEKTALAAWFILFGFLLFITSLAISVIEKNDALKIPNIIGVSLLVLTTLGVVLMPVSGFWLVYPAAIAIIYKNKSGLGAVKT
ncbi:DUF6463 family protein [Pseudoalteromonas sp.]|uniref:DUF6463 family protein n=1 Tax=Pseudoalteromonas sp. TaxID=53249 RepID=UPI003569A621